MLTVACLFRLTCFAALPLGVYRNHENAQNKIALTFDDGPHPRFTPEILDILDRYGVQATFFFVGQNVGYYPETAREVAKRGHEIGNHTHTHPSMLKTNDTMLRRELLECEKVIQSVTDSSPKLFRPPQGNWNERICSLVRELDYSVILWDIDTLDWAGTPADRIFEYVRDNIKSGDIILMHDYHSKGCSTAQALEKILPELLGQGYSFVTVSELIGSQ